MPIPVWPECQPAYDPSRPRCSVAMISARIAPSSAPAWAASVLATRWKVPEDRATSRFVVDFYRAYREGGPEGKGLRKDRALSEARRQSRERGDAAQEWAAWVLVGDAR